MYLWTIKVLAFSSSIFWICFKIFRVLKIDKGMLDCNTSKIFKSSIFTVRYHYVSFCFHFYKLYFTFYILDSIAKKISIILYNFNIFLSYLRQKIQRQLIKKKDVNKNTKKPILLFIRELHFSMSIIRINVNLCNVFG